MTYDQHAIDRRRRRADPAYKLGATHILGLSGTGFATGDLFPARGAPITFATDLQRTGSPSGVVFAFGGVASGVALVVDGDDLLFVAGSDDDEGVEVLAEGVLPAGSPPLRVVAAVVPASGEARLWAGPGLARRAVASEGSLPGGLWGGTGTGSIGVVGDGVPNRVPIGLRGNLAGAAIVSPVTAYAGVVPRFFREG